MSTQRDLETIERELERLHEQSKKLGLNVDEVKKLDVLLKAKALLQGEPTKIVKAAEGISDDAILKAIGNAASDMPKHTRKQ